MNWYRDISKKHTELGFDKDPTMAFVAPFIKASCIYALLALVVFCFVSF